MKFSKKTWKNTGKIIQGVTSTFLINLVTRLLHAKNILWAPFTEYLLHSYIQFLFFYGYWFPLAHQTELQWLFLLLIFKISCHSSAWWIDILYLIVCCFFFQVYWSPHEEVIQKSLFFNTRRVYKKSCHKCTVEEIVREVATLVPCLFKLYIYS